MVTTLPEPGALLRCTVDIETDAKARIENKSNLPNYLLPNYEIPKGTIVMYLSYEVSRDTMWGETDYKYTFIHEDRIYRTRWTARSPWDFFGSEMVEETKESYKPND